MVATILLIVVGVPLIVWLSVRAWRRAQALKRQIARVQDELARDPQASFRLMAEMMQEAERLTPRVHSRKRPHG